MAEYFPAKIPPDIWKYTQKSALRQNRHFTVCVMSADDDVVAHYMQFFFVAFSSLVIVTFLMWFDCDLWLVSLQ